jgi:RHS repeat-associated protein
MAAVFAEQRTNKAHRELSGSLLICAPFRIFLDGVLLWGNHTVTEYTDDSIGALNPIRYRGYYYDQETGLFYLKSRYYDSDASRFINADDPSVLDITSRELNGYNLYAYCFNNPVNATDDAGMLPDWLRITIGIVAIAGYHSVVYIAKNTE